jgi:uncharacterized CHY-type Zn-finger protein
MPPEAGNTEHAVPTRPRVIGVDLDSSTRCAHYHSELDIIAIKLLCCGEYYACKECHDDLAGHDLVAWPAAEYGTPAVLCGACGSELTITEYLASSNRCPGCHAAFNPRCSAHYHFYFASYPVSGPPVSGTP